MKSNRTIIFASILTAALLLVSGSLVAKQHRYERQSGFSSMIKGSGDLTTQTRTTEPFERIETNLGIDMKIEVGKTQSISITFDDNLIDLIRTESDGKTLIIDTDESFSTNENVEVVITVPELNLINSEGSGTIDVVNLKSKRFRLIIAGSGDFTGTGNVEELEVEIDGSGDVKATDIIAKEATVTINGSGSVEVNVTELLDGEINGSGDILYTGKPETVHSSVNGSGSIRKRR